MDNIGTEKPLKRINHDPISLRVNSKLQPAIERFSTQQRIHIQSTALNLLLRYGLQYYELLTNQAEITQTGFAMQTLADSLTEQQKEYLYKIIAKQLGEQEVERINRLVQSERS